MNYRDLQNISNLSQQILVEGANEEHNVLNRWPYTSPYLQENDSQVYDEEYKKLPYDKMIAKSNKFDKQYKTGPTKTDTEYKSTTDASRRRAGTFLTTRFHDPKQSQEKSAANKNRPESEKRSKTASNEKKFGNRLTRSDKQGIKDSYEYHLDEGEKPLPYGRMMKKSDELASTDDKTKQKRAAKIYIAANAPTGPKIKVKEQTDLYDIILSHLLDEGYAETQEQAEVIMVNMSEDWRESIVEGMKPLPVGKMIKQAARHSNPEQVTKMAKVADTHNPNKSQRKEDDNRREGGRKREAGRPRRNELQDNW